MGGCESVVSHKIGNTKRNVVKSSNKSPWTKVILCHFTYDKLQCRLATVLLVYNTEGANARNILLVRTGVTAKISKLTFISAVYPGREHELYV
jgi:hypothetical protein